MGHKLLIAGRYIVDRGLRLGLPEISGDSRPVSLSMFCFVERGLGWFDCRAWFSRQGITWYNGLLVGWYKELLVWLLSLNAEFDLVDRRQSCHKSIRR
jgi:hypothetical protein